MCSHYLTIRSASRQARTRGGNKPAPTPQSGRNYGRKQVKEDGQRKGRKRAGGKQKKGDEGGQKKKKAVSMWARSFKGSCHIRKAPLSTVPPL